ncbi:S1C family serine protease [Paraliomyxa miuraensis]|uniref:S1C family serine protease n=1 Tax=Paraliomyxa miuraensis TaxID=376150 RepID=UPI002252AB9D|nr:S1C family serine protease [Paraliomyxa miuraensis]MCX4247107.1 S1C family serine protease [Paraliomyxa miuraensis]
MNLPTSSDPFVSLVDRASPAIVRVDAPRQGGATGLLWSDDGLVVTAHHALCRDEPLSVTLGSDAEPRPARLLGRDPATDLAVLRIEAAEPASDPESEAAEPEVLAAPTWREAESVRVGELGLALARPGRTVRAALGLVAVVGESLRTPAGRSLTPYVELDRTLPRGFSVAPLLDLQGQVLGLATAGLAPHATVLLTAGVVRPVIDAIVAHGRVPQAFLGVGVSPARLPAELRDQLGQSHALAVVGLAEGGPAATAGLLVGDLILAVADTPVRSPAGLRARLADRIGQPVALRLLRGGQTTELEITAGERR